ncbi:MAG TPA: sigma 54-interacting transcriptional regulator, partial [Pirellulales bacterium]|nr:sigma 54-interacting transcriptional regulator [Pirellulales bacterium]
MAGERTTRPDLIKLLDNSPAPIYVVDEDRRIIFCNAACADWLGVKADVLLGQQCVYHAPPADGTPGAIACELCPPPKALAGQAQAAVIVHVLPGGHIARRDAYFLPLGDGGDECAEILAILEIHERPAGASANVAAEGARLHEEVRQFRTQMAGQFGTDTLIGSSHGAVKVRAQVELAAQTRSAVLILGPPGAGKDHVAKVIHYGQPEPGTLLPLECAIVETNLLRSTLRALDLRHSIAKDLRTTLLLHDVDAAAPEVQADLVEILQLHSGAIRAIATAARPLGTLVGERHFLPRLASALSTVVIELVPLVQRLEDLPLLAQVYLEEANLGSA